MLAVSIEFADPSVSTLPESVRLVMDCEMYTTGPAGQSKCLCRLFPVLPLLNGVRTLRIDIEMDEDGWMEANQWLTDVKYITFGDKSALESFLKADQSCLTKLLFPYLECVILDCCDGLWEWSGLWEFLTRRREQSGRSIQWQALNTTFRQDEQEQELLERMSAAGFEPL